MRRIMLVLIGLTILGWPVPVRASEQIDRFHSAITVNPDTSLNITETIQFTTTEPRHGIYRWLPLRTHGQGLQWRAAIANVQVTNAAQQPLPVVTEKSAGQLKLRIGDADQTFTGTQTYVISYQVRDAVRVANSTQGEFPALYWDITGDGWDFVIASASATIIYPTAQVSARACYTGPPGSTATDCQLNATNQHQHDVIALSSLYPGDNLTIALDFTPDSAINLPSAVQRAWKRFRDNMLLSTMLLPALMMGLWWWRRGRDWSFVNWNVFRHDLDRSQQRAPLWPAWKAPLVYEPIAELTPGETAALLREYVQPTDIVAEIVDLARQKRLQITRLTQQKWWRTTKDYEFSKLPMNNKKPLPAHQDYLLKQIFASGDKVKLSDLAGKFSPHLEKIKALIMQSLTTKKLFVTLPATARLWSLALATVLLLLTGMLAIWLSEQGWWVAWLLWLPSAGLALWFAYHQPARTAPGHNLAWQARGLRHTLARGLWREKINEKHLFFAEMLPFAVALGVVNQLSRDMEKLAIAPPEYLPAAQLNAANLNSWLSDFTSQTSAAINPSQSATWSGGSGTSGGFSGGGGGGGGGGSW